MAETAQVDMNWLVKRCKHGILSEEDGGNILGCDIDDNLVVWDNNTPIRESGGCYMCSLMQHSRAEISRWTKRTACDGDLGR